MIRHSALFIFTFLWFCYPAEYVLIANQGAQLFLTSFNYFHSFLDHPGGIIEYMGSFLSQFLRFRIAGAMILSGVITLNYYISYRLAERASHKNQIHIFGVITPLLLIGMLNYYPDQINHVLSLTLLQLTILIIPEKRDRKQVFLLLAIPVTYIVIGAYVWVFLALYMVEQSIRTSRTDLKTFSLNIGYAALLTLLASRFVYIYPINELLIHPLPLTLEPLLYTAILWILLLPGLMKAAEKLKFLKARWAYVPAIVLCLIAILMLYHITYDKKSRDLFRIEDLAVREDWDTLLEYAAQHPSENRFGSFYTNLALAYKGVLCSDLFKYPTSFGKQGLYMEWAYQEKIFMKGSDFYWAINFVNEAHHWAFESFTTEGFTKRNLIRLIQTELIRGNHEVAEKYIRVLEHSIFDRKLAGHFRKFLYKQTAIEKDPQLGPRMKVNIKSDFFAKGIDQEKNLKLLLVNDPGNLMAFDYLMAIFLLEKRVDDMIRVLPHYLNLSKGQLPTLLEECMLVHYARRRTGRYANIRISKATRSRFEDYNKTYRQCRSKKEAERILQTSFNNTFWYYLDFGSLTKP